MMEHLRDTLNYLRNITRWTQGKLARNQGVSWNTVQRWESGKTNPSTLAREKVHEVYGYIPYSKGI